MDSVKMEPVKEEPAVANGAATNTPINGLVNEEEQMKEIAERVLGLCQENESGVTNKTLDLVFSGVRPEFRALVINKLLGQSKIEILTKGDKLLYKLCQTDKVKNEEEKIVYSIIENAGNKGIWTKDIRYKCNISLIALNKVLKQMESKKLIKSVKSVTASKKKLFMLFDLQPDVSITGGTWYSNQDFEAEFVDVLNQQCLRFLLEKRSKAMQDAENPQLVRHRSYASLSEVWRFIKDLGISKVELSLKDIETLLETLVFDGKAESKVSMVRESLMTDDEDDDDEEEMSKVYRVCGDQLGLVGSGLMRMPCGGCQVINDCRIGGVISPASCVYLKQWLDF